MTLFATLGHMQVLADAAAEPDPSGFTGVVIFLVAAAGVVGLIVVAFNAAQRRTQRRKHGDSDHSN